MLAALVACGRVDPDALPPVPEISRADAAPAVQQQLDAAVAKVAARPLSASANARLAEILQIYRQFAAAEVMYRRTRMLDPDTFDWPYLHGLVLVALGRSEEAIDALRAALALRGDDPYAHFRVAELLAENGETAAAAQHYARAMASRPTPSEAHFSYGRFLLAQGDARPAVEQILAALRQSGDFGAAHYQLGMAYRNLGEETLATRHFELAEHYHGAAADSSDPVLNRLLPLNRSEQPFVDRAKRLAEAGRMDEAQRFVEMALERNPDSAPVHVSMMGLAASRGQFAAVDEHFERAIAIEPDNAKAYFNLGIARMAQRRYGDASAAFKRSLALDDTDPNTHVQLAVLVYREGRQAASERHMRAALAIDPDHSFGNWLLGELLREQGKPAAGLPYLERAVRRPHRLGGQMQVSLAQASAAVGDWDRAFAALDAAEAAASGSNARGLRTRVSRLRAELTAQRDREAAPGAH